MTELVRAGAERLDDLELLWLALTEHHAAVAPDFGPLRSPAERWRRRRAYYEKQLAEPGAFVIIAERDGRPVGYALVAPSRPSQTWALDRTAMLETISVLPEARGGGVGAALVARAREELRAAGVTHLSLGVVAANERAISFYRREGFQDAFLEMIAPI